MRARRDQLLFSSGLAAMLACVCTAMSRAADADGITVSGTGEVSCTPDTVEVRVRVSGRAELSGDAIVKYQDARRRAFGALERLKLKNLKVEVAGVSIARPTENAEQLEVQGLQPGVTGAGPSPKAPIEFASIVRFTLSGIRDTPEENLMHTVAQLIDTIHDAGMSVVPVTAEDSVGPPGDPESEGVVQPLATFSVQSAGEVREQAYQQAFASARSNAERLAKLAGVKLGLVQAIQESEPGMAAAGIELSGDRTKQRVTSHKFGPVPVRVSLQVRFGIER
jgi:uncharacterized protein YggE